MRKLTETKFIKTKLSLCIVYRNDFNLLMVQRIFIGCKLTQRTVLHVAHGLSTELHPITQN